MSTGWSGEAYKREADSLFPIQSPVFEIDFCAEARIPAFWTKKASARVVDMVRSLIRHFAAFFVIRNTILPVDAVQIRAAHNSIAPKQNPRLRLR